MQNHNLRPSREVSKISIPWKKLCQTIENSGNTEADHTHNDQRQSNIKCHAAKIIFWATVKGKLKGADEYGLGNVDTWCSWRLSMTI